MTESSLSTSGVTAVAVAITGYLSGDYTSILFGAIAGSFWPLGGATTESRLKAAWLLVKLVMTALALTGFIAHLLEQHKAVENASFVLGPIAFFIAVLGDRWVRVFDSLANGLVSVVDATAKGVIERVQKLLGVSKPTGDDK
jgi:hypothetical protein